MNEKHTLAAEIPPTPADAAFVARLGALAREATAAAGPVRPRWIPMVASVAAVVVLAGGAAAVAGQVSRGGPEPTQAPATSTTSGEDETAGDPGTDPAGSGDHAVDPAPGTSEGTTAGPGGQAPPTRTATPKVSSPGATSSDKQSSDGRTKGSDVPVVPELPEVPELPVTPGLPPLPDLPVLPGAADKAPRHVSPPTTRTSD